MRIEIQAEIFKWLQNLKLVKEGKRAEGGKIELPQAVATHFFDGLYISHIAKGILEHKKDEETVKRLSAIKQNSTPAIRLYNWNLLGDALKKLGHHIDYSQKSKLLNLETQAIVKIIKFLWSIRIESNSTSGNLDLNTTDIAGKKIREASNVFEFLVILICNHFKLSGQHALNLFLDGNKYLAHLLVKGVKGSFQPVLNLLSDTKKQLDFLVNSLLCIDQKESVDLFLGALKPCLISKDEAVAESFLSFLQQLTEMYLSKSLNIQFLSGWMTREGLDTIFFSIKRHPSLFSHSLSVAYALLQQKLFQKIFPDDKSLLWNNQIQRLSFYRMFLNESHHELLQKFIEHPAFEEWTKMCLKSLKRSYSSQEKYSLIVIFEQIWNRYPQTFEKNQLGLPSAYASFLKTCTFSEQDYVFVEAIRVLFTTIVQLGTAKNQNAPLLYKTAISVLGSQENNQRIDLILEHFLQIMKEIPSLPASPLAEHILKALDKNPTANMLEIVRIILTEDRAKQFEKDDLEESLLKIILSDITYSAIAQDIIIGHLSRTQNKENLSEYCITGLAQFYSISQHVTRSMRQLKLDYQRYAQEENMRKGEPTFLRNLQKFLNLSNIITFIEKAIFINITVKEEIQPHIFHTYIRIEQQLRKEHISRLLMPLLRSYYDEYQLPRKIEEYIQRIRPPVLNFQSIGHSQQISPSNSPPHSNRPRRKKENMKTQESIQTKGMQSIMKDLEQIKKKKEEERQRILMQQKQKQVAEEKKSLHYSMLNKQRKVQHGKAKEVDLDYKYLLDFDSVKLPGNYLSSHDLNLLNLQQDEELPYIEDTSNLMKKYRKIWRYFFFKYSSFGLKGKAEGQLPQQKINGADILKFFKEYQLDLLSKQKVLLLVKKVNELLKRKNDPSNLTYLGFQEYLLQYCFLGYRKEFPQNSPGRQLIKFIEHLRSVTASKGSSVQMFDNPEEMYFQETEVIRQFNRRLSENPDYPLPEGYKKIRQTDVKFHYSLTQFQKGVKPSRQAVTEVLDEILYDSLGFRVLEPLTTREERCLARPVLFQKIKDKMKDYSGGYLMPKRSAYLPRLEKEPSPVKQQFHLYINFSLGIRLGIAGTDPRSRIIAEEVAYWLDDALDAIDAGKLTVGNKSKTRVQNQLIRRKRSEALQFRVEKQEQDRKERARAQTLKHQTEKFREELKEKEKRSRQEMKLQRKKRKQRQQLMLQKKRAQFQQAKSKLQQKRKEIQQKKVVQLRQKKKEKQEYKKGVDQYFQKKKEELQQKQRSIKANKEHQEQSIKQKKLKEEKKKRELEIEIFKKEESVLQKLTESKQTYEEVWKSEDIQEEMLKSKTGLKLMFDLLVKYQKSKISTTGAAEIGLNTINFYCLKSKISPLFIGKTAIAMLFRGTIKKAAIKGIDFQNFQQFIFKVIVKGKQLLNNHSDPIEDDQNFEVEESGLPSYHSSPGIESPSKKSITDTYTLDANGVTGSTVRRMMEFLDLPTDKPEAQQKFREYLETKGVKPLTIMLKQARSQLDSIVI